MDLVLAIVLIVLALAVGIGVGIAYRKKVAEKEIGSAELEATRLINEAIRSGESRKKEMLLEAKDEIHKSRTEYEKEVKERRAELSKQERRLEQKEATLDKKTDALERKDEELNNRLANVAKTQAEADEIKRQQSATLENHTNITTYSLASLEVELREAHIVIVYCALIYIVQTNQTLKQHRLTRATTTDDKVCLTGAKLHRNII